MPARTHRGPDGGWQSSARGTLENAGDALGAIRESTALLSFSLQGISNPLKATPGEAALGRIAAFINYRVLEHVSHNASIFSATVGRGRSAWARSRGRIPSPPSDSTSN